MGFVWDNDKSGNNRIKHGIGFAAVNDFDWETAFIKIDERHDYQEERRIAIGWIDGRLYALVYTRRDEDVRVISLRKANEREKKHYEKETSYR